MRQLSTPKPVKKKPPSGLTEMTIGNGTIRSAAIADGPSLYDVRREAIRALAPPAMPIELARQWADAHPIDWIGQILSKRQVWVFQLVDVVIGWVSVTANNVDGLYTAPGYAQHGVGSRLLLFAEAELRRRGFSEVRLEASWNAEDFYSRRGYEPTGQRPVDGTHYGARPMRKLLSESKEATT